MVDAALLGYGIAYVPEDLVELHVATVDFVMVLADCSPAFFGKYIYYPSRRQNLAAFKTFVAALRVAE